MLKDIRIAMMNIKTYPVLKYALITNILLYAIVIGCFVWQNIETRNLVEKNIKASQSIIETISVIDDKTGRHFRVTTDDIIKPLDDKQKYEYKEFLEKYFEHQSYYLNFWLSLLAIVLGIFAIIVPICFVKFAEDKKKEFDLLIKECKRQKAKTQVNVDQIENKLEKIGEMTKEVKANSKISWLPFDVMLRNYDHALSMLNESVNIIKTEENLSSRAWLYSQMNDYVLAITDLEECLTIKRTSSTLSTLGAYYSFVNNYEKAKQCILEAINMDKQNAVNYYNLTEAYIMLEDFAKALETLNEFIIKERNPYILSDDKPKWIQKIKASQQNDITKLLINIINTKLIIKSREAKDKLQNLNNV